MGLSPDRVRPKTKIGICCFSAKHAALGKKRKDWLALNKDNVSEWGNMSIHGLLFQRASTIKIKLSMLVYYKVDLIIISLKNNCSRDDIAEKLLSWRYTTITLTHSLMSNANWRAVIKALFQYIYILFGYFSHFLFFDNTSIILTH